MSNPVWTPPPPGRGIYTTLTLDMILDTTLMVCQECKAVVVQWGQMDHTMYHENERARVLRP